MSEFNSEKLHIDFKDHIKADVFELPRKYTLTHSDSTGDLFLTIGFDYDFQQISKLYTKFMRDEVLAEWQIENDQIELHIYLHVSGGLVFGWASLRNRIFRYHLPLVIKALKYGDRQLFEENPILDNSQIIVHFNSKNKKYNKIENFGFFSEFEF
ncbi:MAG: staygreen family protein [Promethearchaeota archaeon]|jgi:hypothetical protein